MWARPSYAAVPKYRASPYSWQTEATRAATWRQGAAAVYAQAAARQSGPTRKAVTPSMQIVKASRPAYRESAFAYSFHTSSRKPVRVKKEGTETT